MIDTPTQAANTSISPHANISRTPSAALLDLCRVYLELVDHGTPEQQGAERTQAHNALIAQMVTDGIVESSPHRVLVRWLARYFVQADYLRQEPTAPQSYIMFLRRDTFPPKLETLPPFYEREELAALDYYVPVRVTIGPLLEQNGNVESE